MRLASVRPAIAGLLGIAAASVTGLLAQAPAKTLPELRTLEKKVQEVVEQALPATVSPIFGAIGFLGSGVIVSREGLILTAGHVVEGMEEVTVVFPDGKQAKAAVLGANLSKDAAMAKLKGAGPWPFVEMGDSKGLKVGDFVISLGHAGGYDPLRTPPARFGRIVGRSPLGFIGTDCTLIGGDSGGPLFDLEGRVVAIHSSIGASLMANNHTGLSNFKADWERLKKGENWGKLTMNPLVNADRPVIGLNVERSAKGVRVAEIFPDSPAAVAGLKPGDLVHTIDGKPVRSRRNLQGLLAEREPGDEIELEFSRDGKKRTRTLKLARLADVADLPGEE